MGYFAVIREPGAGWIPELPMAEQPLWTDHARFVNARAEEGFIVLGGPLGLGTRFLLIVNARDEEEIQQTLDDDPWTLTEMLAITSVKQWEVTTGPERVLELFRELATADRGGTP